MSISELFLFTYYPLLFFFFWPLRDACGILVLQPESKPMPQHWEHGVLSTGLPEKSLLSITLNLLPVLLLSSCTY